MFTIEAEGIKPHVATTEIAAGIMDDLVMRFGCLPELNEAQGKPAWDPGGPLLLNQPEVDLGVFKVNAQHAEMCKALLENLLADGPRKTQMGRPYYKLHGRWVCICVTHTQLMEALGKLSKCPGTDLFPSPF